MHNIPICLFSHSCLRSKAGSRADQQVNDTAKRHVQQHQHNSRDYHNHNNGNGVVAGVFLAGPHNLFQLAFGITEILGDTAKKFLTLAVKGTFFLPSFALAFCRL